jgi:hypothetical protein
LDAFSAILCSSTLTLLTPIEEMVLAYATGASNLVSYLAKWDVARLTSR